MKKEITIIFISICLFLISCKSTKTIENNYGKYYFLPPGTLKISDNFFVDQCEIRNIDYLEYVNWIKKIHGFNSQDYISALPDTSQWNKLGKYYHAYALNYFRNAIYKHNPVVGISYLQANKFAKWRSDRVMEFLLVREGIFKYNPNPNKDSEFTIEKYFSGNYLGIKPNSEIYYPEYSLIDSTQYISIYKYTDSLNNIQNNLNENDCYCYDKLSGKGDTILYGPNPTMVSNFYGRKPTKKESILNLKGNVRELTAKDGQVFGGSFKDSCKVGNKISFFKETNPNCYTGFRNKCSFKKYDYR